MAFRSSSILRELDDALKSMGKGLSAASQAKIRSLLVSEDFVRLRTQAETAMHEIPNITQPIQRTKAYHTINLYRDALADAFRKNIDSLSPSEALDLVDNQILHLDADIVASLDKARTRKDRARARGENDHQGEPKRDGDNGSSNDDPRNVNPDGTQAGTAADSLRATAQQPLPKPDRIEAPLTIASQSTLSLLLQKGYNARIPEAQLSLLEAELRAAGLIQPATSSTFFNRRLPTNFKEALRDLNAKIPVPEEIFQRVIERGGIGTLLPKFRIEGHRTSFWNGLNPMFWIGLPRAAESIRWRGLGDTQSLLRTTAAVALTAGIGWGGVSTYNAGHDFLFGPEAVTIAGVDVTNLTAEQIKQLPKETLGALSKTINDYFMSTDFTKLDAAQRRFADLLGPFDKFNFIVPGSFEQRTGYKASPIITDFYFEQLSLNKAITPLSALLKDRFDIDYDNLVSRLDKHDLTVYETFYDEVIKKLKSGGNPLPPEILMSTIAALADRFNISLPRKDTTENGTSGKGKPGDEGSNLLPYTLDDLEIATRETLISNMSYLLKTDASERKKVFKNVFGDENLNVVSLPDVIAAFDKAYTDKPFVLRAIADYLVSSGNLGIDDPTLLTNPGKRAGLKKDLAKNIAEAVEEQRKVPTTVTLTAADIRVASRGGTGQPAAPPHPVTAPPPPDYSRSAGGETPQRLTLAVFQDAVKQCTLNPGNNANPQATRFAEQFNAAFTKVAGQGVQTLPSDRYAALLKEVTNIVNQLNVVDKTNFGYNCLGLATQMLKP